jgi:RHS repeat-associated protein
MTPNMLFIFLGIAFVLWFIARAYETGGGVVGMLMRRFLAQSRFGQVFIAIFLIACCVSGGSKRKVPAGAPEPVPAAATSAVPLEPLERLEPLNDRTGAPRAGALTPAQYAAGFARISAATNPAAWRTAPSNAVVHAPWTVYGVAEDIFWLRTNGWSFTLGTNQVDGLYVSSSGLVSFQNPLSTPSPSSVPENASLLAPLHGSFGTVPPQGRFWHALTASNSLLLTWENLYAGRDTNCPVSFQSELFKNGDFAFRYSVPSNSALRSGGHAFTNLFIGARHNGGGEAFARNDPAAPADGLELRWRAFGMLDPDVSDHDGDGLSTHDELFIHGTDPSMADTDLDGLSDGAETALGTCPLTRDTDGDGLCDGSDPDPRAPTPAADLDGDGLPDAWEIFRYGATGVAHSASDISPSGFTHGAALLAGADPAAAGLFFIPAPSLSNTLAAALLAPPFTVTTGRSGLTNLIWERTFTFRRASSAFQAFLSSAPDRAAPVRLEGAALEWSGGTTGGVFTAFPPDDSLRLPLPAQPGDFTLRLRAASPSAPAANRQPLYLLAWTPGVSFPTAVDAAGLPVIAPGSPPAIPVAVNRAARPHRAPPDDLELAAAAPFTGVEGLAFDAGASTLAAARPGVYPLPPAAFTLLPPAARGAPPVDFVIAAPSLRWSGDHCGGLAYSAEAEKHYSRPCEYPLDSGCLWRDWTTHQSGACNCVLTLDAGLPDDCPYAFQTGGNTLYVNGVAVWQGEVPPHDHDCGIESGRELLSGPECGGCGDACASGDCAEDETEGDSHGSFQFRIPLGRPAKGRAAGFVWLRADAPAALSPAALNVLPSPWFADTLTVSSNAHGVASLATPWRSVTVTPVPHGVALTVTDPGADPYTWTLANPGGDTARIRVTREEAGNVIRDMTYVLSTPGVSARTDNLTGLTETLAREDRLNAPEATLTETRSVSDAARELSRTVTVSKRIGIGPSAVLREVYREECGAYSDSNPRTSRASYHEDGANPARNGTPRFAAGSDRPWRYTARDARGRTVLALDQRDGSYEPSEDQIQALDAFAAARPDGIPAEALADLPFWPPPCTLTLYAYAPADPADSADPADAHIPRAESVFVLRDPASGALPVAALARVLTRFETNGLPAVAAATTRLPPPGVPGDGQTSLDVRYADMGVPDAFRNLPLLEITGDGVTNSHAYTPGGYDPAARAFTADPSGAFIRAVSASSASPLAEVRITDAAHGRLLLRETRHAATDSPLAWEASAYDEKGRLLRTEFSDGTALTNLYDCCRLAAVRSRDGAVTEHWHIPGVPGWSAEAETSAGSLPGAGGAHPVTETFRDGFGRVTNTVRCVWKNGARDPASAPLETRTAYPHGVCDHRVTTDPLGVQTVSAPYLCTYYEADWTASAGVTGIVHRYRGGATVEEERWTDPASGEELSRIVKTETSWDADGRETVTVSVSRNNGPWATESVTRKDFLGRAVVTERAGHGGAMLVTSNAYNAAGRLAFTRNPDGSASAYAYGGFGELAGTMRIGAGQTLDFDPLDFTPEGVAALDKYAIEETPSWMEESDLGLSVHGVPTAWWDCSAVVSRIPGQGAATASVTRVQLTGLSPACTARTVATDADGVTVITTEALDAAHARKTVTRLNTATLSAETSVFTAGRETARTNALGAAFAYRYDGFGRQTAVTQSAGDRVLQTVTGYHADGTVAHTAEICGGVTNATAYSPRQYTGSPGTAYRVTVTGPLGNVTTNHYSGDGTPYRSGGAAYPHTTVRDADGNRTELHTWRDEGGPPDVTRWRYDSASGLVTNKVYADGLGPSYAYTPDGRLSRRTWARGVTATHGYSDTPDGRIQTVLYSGPTPNVTNRYDLAGRLAEVVDGTGTRSFAYDARGRVTAETNALDTSERQYDGVGRLSSFSQALPVYSAETFTVFYGYDEFGRVASVSSAVPALAFGFSYLPGTAMVSGMTGTAGLGRSVAYEPARNLITAVSNLWAGSPVSVFAYANDAAGRRVSRNADSFGYNARSEVTGAVIGTNNYGYAYDAIGNRVWSAVNTLTNTYTANALNQYTAAGSVSPVYDADGNMRWDGRMWHTWDAENRLVHSEPGWVGSTNGAVRVVNSYDHRHRRIQKRVEVLTGRGAGYPFDPSQGGTWDVVETRTFIYDGWNLTAEVVVDAQAGTTNVTRYLWGPDVSGTLQGAGGVGGLLAVIRSDGTFFPCYDANGNITDYVDGNGTVRGHFEYDAFGNTIAMWGDLVHTFKFRFSTKYWDEETRSYYYGYRHYAPKLGCWLSRDPIGERGDLKLYGFVKNDPINKWDYLGLCPEGFYWSWSANMCLPKPPPPLPVSIPEVGFAVIADEIDPDMLEAKVLNLLGVYHVDITYNGTVVYVGAGGGPNRWRPDNKFVSTVYPLSIRSSGTLRYGKAGLKCKCATESDILECLRAKQRHRGWNCQGDVQEAVDKCCLSGFRTVVSTMFYWID